MFFCVVVVVCGVIVSSLSFAPLLRVVVDCQLSVVGCCRCG